MGFFESDYNMQRIILSIGAITGEQIISGKTLIILDEIQELHRGLASLKYFCEDAPEYHVAVAGSLLGIMLHEGESYPVGKVNTITMHPMTYEEFLLAKGRSQMVDLLNDGKWDVIQGLKTLYIQALREYYFVGGMPEAVKKFIETNDSNQVREIQQEILWLTTVIYLNTPRQSRLCASIRCGIPFPRSLPRKTRNLSMV